MLAYPNSRRRVKTRERVRRFRQKNKLKANFEKNVRVEMERRESESANFFNNVDCRSIESVNGNVFAYDERINLKENLKRWAVKHCITKMAINDLLAILIPLEYGHLPKDSRTLMNTPTHVEIRELSKGKLWYRGIECRLLCILANVQFKDDVSFHLDFNFDGVPLFKSSTKAFWPMLASIRGLIFFIN